MREQAFFHADQEHQRKLQTLGAVQGHQLHAVLVVAGLLFAGLQRGVVEEGGQGRLNVVFLFAVTVEGAGGGYQFLEVFHSRLGLLALLVAVVGQQPGFLDDQLRHAVQRQFLDLQRQGVDQFDEAVQRAGGAPGNRLGADCLMQRSPHRQALFTGQLTQAFDGLLADAAGRHVDHPLQRRVVVAGLDQAQVGHGVLDLGALEEALAAVDAVGDLLAQQRLFQYPRLGVGAVEDGDLAAAHAIADGFLDALDHVTRFVVLVEGSVQADRLALAAGGPEFLAEATLVVGDQRVGGLEDAGGGAVVLFQADGFGIREVGAELVQVLDARAAPAVDRLVVVADHHQALATLGQQPQPGVLDGVGVLELIHQHMAEASLVVLEQAGVVAPQIQRTQQQLGEVDDASAGAGLFIGFVDLQLCGEEQITAGLDVAWTQAFVLLRVDPPLRLARRPALLIEAELADHPLDQALLVIGVENLEILRQLRLAPVSTQQAVGQAVKGAHPHALGVHVQ